MTAKINYTSITYNQKQNTNSYIITFRINLIVCYKTIEHSEIVLTEHDIYMIIE